MILLQLYQSHNFSLDQRNIREIHDFLSCGGLAKIGDTYRKHTLFPIVPINGPDRSRVPVDGSLFKFPIC